jgi:hypothetical protein
VKAESKLILWRRRLISLTYRVLNQLEFFPFTLLYVLFNAVLKLILLRMRRGLVRVGVATGETVSLPRDAMVWLGRDWIGPPGHQFDVCLHLSRENCAANLHDVFSVVLTFPRVRSVGLYWESSSLADDLPLLQSKQDRDDPAVSAMLYEEISSAGRTQFVEFVQAEHAEFALPVAAYRDAQTLLKRHVGAARAVCLNVPGELWPFAGAIAEARPEIQFFHFSVLPQLKSIPNIESFFDCGFTLHERMALVQAADAYVGCFDELGCTALISGRPVILLGGDAGEQPDRISCGEISLWFPDPAATPKLTEVVLQFLSHQLGPGENW